MHLDLNQRIGLSKSRQNPWQEAHRVVVRCADTHGADHVRFAKGGEHFAVQFENAPRIAKQDLTLSGETYLTPIALEQLTLQHVFLESLHLHAHRRLGSVYPLARLGEAAFVSNRHKGAQYFGVNALVMGHRSISEMCCIKNIRWIDGTAWLDTDAIPTGGQDDER